VPLLQRTGKLCPMYAVKRLTAWRTGWRRLNATAIRMNKLSVLTRPIWGQKLTESQVWKLRGCIVKITHHWEVTGCDTSRDWVEFHTKDGGKFRAPCGWKDLFEFSPDHRGLINPNYVGREACKVLDNIRAWEKQNANDIAELNRLQQKLGLAPKEPTQ
jgi:hypothetical protein